MTRSTAESGVGNLDGGTGNDTLSYAASNAAVAIDLSANTAQGGHATGDTFLSLENAIGPRFRDVLMGNDLSNSFEGGIGGDTLMGGIGSDTPATFMGAPLELTAANFDLQ